MQRPTIFSFTFIDHRCPQKCFLHTSLIRSRKMTTKKKKKPPWILQKNPLNFPHLDSCPHEKETPFEISRTISLARAIPPGTFHSRDASKWINSRRRSTSLVRISRSDRFRADRLRARARTRKIQSKESRHVSGRGPPSRSFLRRVQGRNLPEGLEYCAALCLFLVTRRGEGLLPVATEFLVQHLPPKKQKPIVVNDRSRVSCF